MWGITKKKGSRNLQTGTRNPEQEQCILPASSKGIHPGLETQGQTLPGVPNRGNVTAGTGGGGYRELN